MPYPHLPHVGLKRVILNNEKDYSLSFGFCQAKYRKKSCPKGTGPAPAHERTGLSNFPTPLKVLLFDRQQAFFRISAKK
jgi:hypothetical protein